MSRCGFTVALAALMSFRAASAVSSSSTLVGESTGCSNWGMLSNQKFVAAPGGASGCEAKCKSFDWCSTWLIGSSGQCAVAGPEKCTPASNPMFTFYTYDRTASEVVWGSQVKLDVFYSTTCPHCLDVLNEAVMPLMRAGLPADSVQITLLPIGYGAEPSLDVCLANPKCKSALLHLCALREAQPMPSPADSEGLGEAAGFVACDIEARLAGHDADGTSAERCATKRGIAWTGSNGLEACSKGVAGFDLIDALQPSELATSKLMKAGIPNSPLPWVFLDDKLFHCTGDDCTHMSKPSGPVGPMSEGEPTGKTASLLWHVCSGLEPRPAACANMLSDESWQQKDEILETTSLLQATDHARRYLAFVGAFSLLSFALVWHRSQRSGVRSQDSLSGSELSLVAAEESGEC